MDECDRSFLLVLPTSTVRVHDTKSLYGHTESLYIFQLFKGYCLGRKRKGAGGGDGICCYSYQHNLLHGKWCHPHTPALE
jgi:hypothetical protein